MATKADPKYDPCLSCVLPDCDDSDPCCGCRIASRRYFAALRAGALTPELRAARAHAYNTLYAAKRNEARRVKKLAGAA